jgi:acetyl-CoA hydrolase
MAINGFRELTAQEAASYIKNGDMIGFSGFTAAGSPKIVPRVIAQMAKDFHAQGKPFTIDMISGASTGKSVDETLAQADAILHRYGYQSSSALRQKINEEKVFFQDIHLSHVSKYIAMNRLRPIDTAIIEICDVTADGKVYLTTGIGISPILLEKAKKVILELNSYHSPRLREMSDVVVLHGPNSWPKGLDTPLSKVGTPFAQVDPKKVIGIVKNNEPDEVSEFSDSDATCVKIAENVEKFLLDEMAKGSIPKSFLPIQSGVGNIGNAVMKQLGESKGIPPFYMYTEVLQDSLIPIMHSGKLLGASTCALTVTTKSLNEVYSNMDFFAKRVVLRPQDVSNNIIASSQLGVISINTALETDIYGNVNSTHVAGTKLMNGIGGSADFSRGPYISIFICPSIAKGGKISSIVPMCPHIDSSEHSVQIIITENGIADLRGKAPSEKADILIKNCVHPMYHDYLMNYVKSSKPGHIRHNLEKCFELHTNLLKTGSMLP